MKRGLGTSRTLSRRRFTSVATGAAIATAGVLTTTSIGARAQSSTPVASPSAAGGSLTIYSGRSESLVGGLIPQIEAATGISLDVRYGNTAEMAAQILEEGDNTPAGLFLGQDAGALGALAKAGRFAPLPTTLLDLVEPRFRSNEGTWIGVSGRARVLAYNPEVTDPAILPASILDLPTTDLGGPIGWAPANASFQSFVTALRITEGEDVAAAWLQAMIDAGTITFEGNGQQIEAVANEEIAVGIVNHYYLYEFRRETPDIPVENYFFPDGDLGSLINVAGVGVIADSGQDAAAIAVVEYLLSEEGQSYFAEETGEYPLAAGVEPPADLVPLADLDSPEIDLGDLDDLSGTLTLLTELGLI